MDQDRETRIRARAHALWEENGRQDGSHEAHWQQAEREVGEEESAKASAAQADPPQTSRRKSVRRTA